MKCHLKHVTRALLASAILAAGLSAATAETTLHVVPHADLPGADPINGAVEIVKMHGLMVYDTLYALDENLVPQPQMVEDMTLSEDRKTYRFTLRDGLIWHDGHPVTAEDCVASLKRWMSRDAAGQLMGGVLSEIKAIDAKTFEMVFKEPYGLVLESLSKVAPSTPFMMPKRIAETDPFEDIKEYVGSGPFRFVAEEWVPGSKVVYEKFDGYVPRQEPPSAFAGGKVVNVDRVEWMIINDQQTALSALLSGEVDIWENPSLDLQPVIEAAGNLKTATISDTGRQAMMLFNHIQPPFDNPKARQAMFWLTNQETYLQAINGNPDSYRTCASFFICGTPMETHAGLEALEHPDPAKAKALFEEAGWDFSKPIVILDPTDDPIAHPATVVTVQAMRDIGLTVDVQAMDRVTMLKRRNSKEPTDAGGWNMLHSWVNGQVAANPIWSRTYASLCDKGMFGWSCDAELESLRWGWALADGLEAKKEAAARYSERAFEVGQYVPLGQWTTYIAHSDKVTGLVSTRDVPVFWNLEKQD